MTHLASTGQIAALIVIAAVLIVSGSAIAVYCTVSSLRARDEADRRAIQLAEVINDMIEARIEEATVKPSSHATQWAWK